jgi:hypothetical protein
MISDGFRDFNRYVIYFDTVTISKLESLSENTIIQFFTGEILWDQIMIKLTSITGDAVIALRTVSFFITFTWACLLFSKIPALWAFLFLLNTTSIDVAMSGIRNGFAWSLVFIGLYSRKQFVKYILFGLAPFIHSTSIVLLFFLLVKKIRLYGFLKKIPDLFVATMPGIAVALALTVLNELVVGSIIGDRRVGVDYIRGGGSELRMIFWVILLVIILRSHKYYFRKYSFQINILTWFLVMMPFIPWSYRVWGASMPLFAIAIWDLPKKNRTFIKYLWIGYTIVGYLYWTKLINFWYPFA